MQTEAIKVLKLIGGNPIDWSAIIKAIGELAAKYAAPQQQETLQQISDELKSLLATDKSELARKELMEMVASAILQKACPYALDLAKDLFIQKEDAEIVSKEAMIQKLMYAINSMAKHVDQEKLKVKPGINKDEVTLSSAITMLEGMYLAWKKAHLVQNPPKATQTKSIDLPSSASAQPKKSRAGLFGSLTSFASSTVDKLLSSRNAETSAEEESNTNAAPKVTVVSNDLSKAEAACKKWITVASEVLGKLQRASVVGAPKQVTLDDFLNSPVSNDVVDNHVDEDAVKKLFTQHSEFSEVFGKNQNAVFSEFTNLMRQIAALHFKKDVDMLQADAKQLVGILQADPNEKVNDDCDGIAIVIDLMKVPSSSQHASVYALYRNYFTLRQKIIGVGYVPEALLSDLRDVAECYAPKVIAELYKSLGQDKTSQEDYIAQLKSLSSEQLDAMKPIFDVLKSMVSIIPAVGEVELILPNNNKSNMEMIIGTLGNAYAAALSHKQASAPKDRFELKRADTIKVTTAVQLVRMCEDLYGAILHESEFDAKRHCSKLITALSNNTQIRADKKINVEKIKFVASTVVIKPAAYDIHVKFDDKDKVEMTVEQMLRFVLVKFNALCSDNNDKVDIIAILNLPVVSTKRSTAATAATVMPETSQPLEDKSANVSTSSVPAISLQDVTDRGNSIFWNIAKGKLDDAYELINKLLPLLKNNESIKPSDSVLFPQTYTLKGDKINFGEKSAVNISQMLGILLQNFANRILAMLQTINTSTPVEADLEKNKLVATHKARLETACAAARADKWQIGDPVKIIREKFLEVSSDIALHKTVASRMKAAGDEGTKDTTNALLSEFEKLKLGDASAIITQQVLSPDEQQRHAVEQAAYEAEQKRKQEERQRQLELQQRETAERQKQEEQQRKEVESKRLMEERRKEAERKRQEEEKRQAEMLIQQEKLAAEAKKQAERKQAAVEKVSNDMRVAYKALAKIPSDEIQAPITAVLSSVIALQEFSSAPGEIYQFASQQSQHVRASSSVRDELLASLREDHGMPTKGMTLQAHLETLFDTLCVNFKTTLVQAQSTLTLESLKKYESLVDFLNQLLTNVKYKALIGGDNRVVTVTELTDLIKVVKNRLAIKAAKAEIEVIRDELVKAYEGEDGCAKLTTKLTSLVVACDTLKALSENSVTEVDKLLQTNLVELGKKISADVVTTIDAALAKPKKKTDHLSDVEANKVKILCNLLIFIGDNFACVKDTLLAAEPVKFYTAISQVLFNQTQAPSVTDVPLCQSLLKLVANVCNCQGLDLFKQKIELVTAVTVRELLVTMHFTTEKTKTLEEWRIDFDSIVPPITQPNNNAAAASAPNVQQPQMFPPVVLLPGQQQPVAPQVQPQMQLLPSGLPTLDSMLGDIFSSNTPK